MAAIGAGIAAVKYGNAKKKEAKSQCDKEYNKYLSVMYKNHKKPMTYQEYCD